MANVIFVNPVDAMMGKMKKTDDGYFYTTASGKRLFRKRDESYHQHHSPKQKWTAQAFAYAHAQMKERFSTPEAKAQMEKDWKLANKIGANGKVCLTAHAWQFGMLQLEWKLANPFDTWSLPS